MQATFIKDVSEKFTGTAKVWRCNPPMENNEYVVTSETDVWAVETYIFPCTIDGEVTDWAELPGSRKGFWEHEEVLQEAGYEAVYKNTKEFIVEDKQGYKD